MSFTSEEMREYFKRYRKTKRGHILLRYWGICKKVRGYEGNRRWYVGLEVCSREEFLSWANNSEFNKLWYAWVDSDFSRALTPTVDRVVPEKGYVIGNMQWLSLSENSVKGGASETQRKKSKTGFIGVENHRSKFKAYVSNKGKTVYLGVFPTPEEAARCRDKWAKVYQGKYAKLNFRD